MTYDEIFNSFLSQDDIGEEKDIDEDVPKEDEERAEESEDDDEEEWKDIE